MHSKSFLIPISFLVKPNNPIPLIIPPEPVAFYKVVEKMTLQGLTHIISDMRV